MVSPSDPVRRGCCEFTPAECDEMRVVAKRRAKARLAINSEGKKACRRCGHMRFRTAFYSDPGYRDGHDSVCKSCRRPAKRSAMRKRRAKK